MEKSGFIFKMVKNTGLVCHRQNEKSNIAEIHD